MESLTARGKRIRLTDDQRRRLAAKGQAVGRKVAPGPEYQREETVR